MPRKARFTVENGTYYMMMRGNNKNEIFHCEEDFRKYLEKEGVYSSKEFKEELKKKELKSVSMVTYRETKKEESGGDKIKTIVISIDKGKIKV